MMGGAEDRGSIVRWRYAIVVGVLLSAGIASLSLLAGRSDKKSGVSADRRLAAHDHIAPEGTPVAGSGQPTGAPPGVQVAEPEQCPNVKCWREVTQVMGLRPGPPRFKPSNRRRYASPWKACTWLRVHGSLKRRACSCREIPVYSLLHRVVTLSTEDYMAMCSRIASGARPSKGRVRHEGEGLWTTSKVRSENGSSPGGMLA